MFRNQRIPALIDILEMHVVQAVFDKTGLTGTYDFDLNIRSDSPPTGLGAGSMEPGPRSDPALTMMRAVAGMGLKLSPARSPVEVLVVDRVNKEPTEN
jgi:uncharacterized protein (TIGR03435 family)